jgi:hypothetical protein
LGGFAEAQATALLMRQQCFTKTSDVLNKTRRFQQLKAGLLFAKVSL